MVAGRFVYALPFATLDELIARLQSEGFVGMAPLARMCGQFRTGANVHPATISRWGTDGVAMPDGSRLRLEAVKLCGRLVSSKQALLRFISAQQQPADAPTAAPVRSPSARQKASEEAARELEKLGC